VTVSGLAPETRYSYSVGTSTATLAGGDSTYFFTTAPPSGASRPLRIWATGDSGTANANVLAVRDSYLSYAAGRPTDVWLMLGDNAYFSGTDMEYQAAVFDAFSGVLRNTFLWPAGTSGQVGGGTLDHPAMFFSAAQLGSLVIDVDADRLDARFLTSTRTLADHFTLLRSTSFHTIASCRLLDTRLPPGAGGGPTLAAGAQRVVTVAGRCGIPASARTIAANVTATGSTAAGWISVAANAAAPPATSTLNFRAGQTRANNARVSLGPGGSLAVRSGMTAGAVDVVIDVSGYFD
jgi:hypothetical protein